MECGICSRQHDALRNPFLCPADARLEIYNSRLRHLTVLLEIEDCQKRIHAIINVSSDTSTAYSRDAAVADTLVARQKTDQILKAADRLRDDIQAARDEVRARKASLARRRSDLTSVAAGLAERRSKQHREVDKSVTVSRFRWAQSAEDMAATRAFLCTEALRLYGLRRSSKKTNTGRWEYFLGKVPILDLTAMDELSPHVISTSLALTAHILILISHYLAIRLPAEITLPHRDYPRPTIFNLQSSYRRGDVTPDDIFTTATLTSMPEPTSHSHVPRPRPLHVEKPLPQLYREDPAAYSLFLEGVTLLAYNIAWLCCSQGIPVGDRASFDDICNLGRNLYAILSSQNQGSGFVAEPPSSPYPRSPSSDSTGFHSQRADPDRNWLGRYSHGTSYYFLGGPAGTELAKSFKLPNPVKLTDKLKRRLIGDIPAPDWELLNDDAWKDEGVVGNAAAAAAAAGTMGYLNKAVGALGARRRNSTGWMKVKSRFS